MCTPLLRIDTIPGTYVWYPETGELRHITYMGDDEESAWAVFTDDFRYFLEDHGTAPGIRGVSVSRVVTRERIFLVGYLTDIRMNGYTIEVANLVWNDKVRTFVENFMDNNPVPPGIEFVTIFELNFHTGERRLIRVEYI